MLLEHLVDRLRQLYNPCWTKCTSVSNHHSSRLILSYHLLSCVFIVYCVYMYVCSPQHSGHCAQDEDGKFIHNIVSFSKSLLCTHVNNLQLIHVSITVETYEHLVCTK